MKLIKNYSYGITKDGKVFSYIRLKYLKQRKTKTGYLRVGLCKNGIVKDFYIHRLVAKYFVQNQHNYNEVNHIDGNKANNNYKNIEWCSKSQNQKHAIKLGLLKINNKGRNNPMYGKKHSKKSKQKMRLKRMLYHKNIRKAY